MIKGRDRRENGPPLDGAVAGGAVGHAAAAPTCPQAAAKQIQY